VRLRDVCSHELITVTSDASIDEAVRLMREQALRRLPVVKNDKPVGIVSLGDLAVERDPESTLADISAASPNV
jgi:CBS domain-containing protein